MFLTNLQATGEWFEVLQTANLNRTAVTNLGPGESSIEGLNPHPESDHVLLVLDGEVLAVVAEEKATLRRGDVVFVPAGVDHHLSNNSTDPARTLSVYTSSEFFGGSR